MQTGLAIVPQPLNSKCGLINPSFSLCTPDKLERKSDDLLILITLKQINICETGQLVKHTHSH